MTTSNVAGSAGAAFDLPQDHPGVADLAYRQRREIIAEAADRFVPGTPIPEVSYTPEEDDVWRVVSQELGRKHERYACGAYRRGSAALALRPDREGYKLGDFRTAMERLFYARRIKNVPYGSASNATFHIVRSNESE